MFDFINDDKFRTILERDFKELETLYSSKASKSVLVMTGSLIETVLVEYFLNKIPQGYTEGKVLSSSLNVSRSYECRKMGNKNVCKFA